MVTSRSYPETEKARKYMRKFTNSEADDVAELVAINSQVSDMRRNLRDMEKKQIAARAALKPVVAKHGEAHNADYVVTISPAFRVGYVVEEKHSDKFNIAPR
tara:strand:- start:161 stop:466 length:306 start_codon:yes stop_codon:yes gene_type:complete